jgi:DNA excision repair protein ERCC-5
MRPEDLDFDSPEFHSLPTEVQYEIIGDLRIRSRQQSHKRLASMLQKAPTPLDFSKAQIAQLSQRNVLTQRLLTVTDTIGNSGLQIPVRVASERNREYVLVRNPEAEGGGWVLGVRDQGTEQAPIIVEESPRKKKKAQRARIVDGVLRREKRKHESDSEEASGDERDGEEKETDEDEVVPIPFTMDPDLRASRQKEFLDAIARRHTPKKAGGKQTYDQVIKAKPKQKESVPLFIEDDVEVENAEDGGDNAVDEFEEVQANRSVTTHVPVEPPSSDVEMEEIEVEVPIPDLDLRAAMSESVIEALRRREEEDRALLAALRASKSDARLHFDAAEKDGSIAETRSTMTESVKDLGSDDDDESMEEIPLEKTTGRKTAAEPFSEVSPFFPPEPPVAGPSRTRVDSETPNKTVVTSKDYARPPSPTLQSNGLLDMIDDPSTDDAAPLVNLLLVDPEVDALQQTPKSKSKAQAVDPFSTPLAKPAKQPAEPRSEARNSHGPIVNDRPLVTPAKVQPERPQPPVQVPRQQETIKRSAPSLPQVRATKTIEMPSVPVAPKSTRGSGKENHAQKEKAETPASEAQIAPSRRPFTASTSDPSPFLDVADKMDEEPEANSNPREQQIMSLPAPRSAEIETDVEPIVQPDPGVAGTPDDKEKDMEWEASPPPAPKQLSRNVSKALSDVQQQDNFDRALLRASRDPDEDDFDDSLSIRDDDDDSDDGLSEHERAEHRKGIFPAPPRDLAEDEGGVDMNAEGDDYARFLSQIKGRNLIEVRQEIDNEIRTLNQQNKVAMRDSEEITHQMVAQIQLMLRLFGIPYITAPMEAEAQCAELARLNLVDGVITDDNDVFLFGGTQCFKNLFNDAKYVECFIANDLDRELMLNRDRLISLAYLLGSDYTIGLPGVGPVVAMELMAEFPGPRGLEDFKQWWLEVQLGKDDTSIQTKFQKTFVSDRSAKR